MATVARNDEARMNGPLTGLGRAGQVPAGWTGAPPRWYRRGMAYRTIRSLGISYGVGLAAALALVVGCGSGSSGGGEGGGGSGGSGNGGSGSGGSGNGGSGAGSTGSGFGACDDAPTFEGEGTYYAANGSGACSFAVRLVDVAPRPPGGDWRRGSFAATSAAARWCTYAEVMTLPSQPLQVLVDVVGEAPFAAGPERSRDQVVAAEA